MAKKLPMSTIQVGKNGLTHGIIQKIRNDFTKRENVKIHLLKAAGHEKAQVKQMVEAIIEQFGVNYTYRVMGFSIFLKKWRKDKR